MNYYWKYSIPDEIKYILYSELTYIEYSFWSNKKNEENDDL